MTTARIVSLSMLALCMIACTYAGPTQPSANVEASCPFPLTDHERAAFYDMCRQAALNEYKVRK